MHERRELICIVGVLDMGARTEGLKPKQVPLVRGRGGPERRGAEVAGLGGRERGGGGLHGLEIRRPKEQRKALVFTPLYIR